MARYLNDLDANVTLDNTDIYLTEQSGVDKKVTLNEIKNFVLESVFPIGSIYTQLPGKSTPSALNYPGSWTNISSSYAGDFMRIEGGEASAFESGEQLDQMFDHKHSFGINSNGTGGNGRNGFYGIGTINNSYDPSIGYPSAGDYGNPRTGNETRPVNQTIRIWERTA